MIARRESGLRRVIRHAAVRGLSRETGSEPDAQETSLMNEIGFIGLDVHRQSISGGGADGGRPGSVEYPGEVDNDPDALRMLLLKAQFKGVRSASARACRRAKATKFRTVSERLSSRTARLITAPAPRSPLSGRRRHALHKFVRSTAARPIRRSPPPRDGRWREMGAACPSRGLNPASWQLAMILS